MEHYGWHKTTGAYYVSDSLVSSIFCRPADSLVPLASGLCGAENCGVMKGVIKLEPDAGRPLLRVLTWGADLSDWAGVSSIPTRILRDGSQFCSIEGVAGREAECQTGFRVNASPTFQVRVLKDEKLLAKAWACDSSTRWRTRCFGTKYMKNLLCVLGVVHIINAVWRKCASSTVAIKLRNTTGLTTLLLLVRSLQIKV